MDKKWYSAECLGDSVIALGKAGEGEAVRVEIDVSEWAAEHPYAEYKLFVKPPKPGAPYFARIDGPEDGVIGWTLKKNDTQHAGGGVIELMLISGEEVLLKSATARTELLPSPSMSGASDSPPEANETWWEDALEKIDKAKQEAIQSVESAVDRAEEAAAKAEAANENIEETVTDLRHDINALADTIAILHAGVPDTSAKAASHELYATDAPMHVTLYGATTQAGSGDPSPDNVRPISGVETAWVHCGSKNLITNNDFPWNTRTYDEGWYVAVEYDSDRHFDSVVLSLAFKDAMFTNSSGALIAFVKADGTTKYVTSVAFGLKANETINERKSKVFKDVTFKQLRIAFISNSYSMWSGQIIDAQLEVGDTATPYEPYNANVVTPPLLPDGEALYEDCMVENDATSGCDEVFVFDGTHNVVPVNTAAWKTCAAFYFLMQSVAGMPLSATGSMIYSDILPAATKTDYTTEGINTNAGANGYVYLRISFDQLGIEPTTDADVAKAALNAYFAARKPKVFYRSTEYTPDKDLRVCKVTKNTYTHVFDGTDVRAMSTVQGNRRYTVDMAFKPGAYNSGWCSHFKESSAVIGLNNLDNAISVYTDGKAYIRADRFENETALDAYFVEQYANGTPVTYTYKLTTPEVYMTDPLELRKPTGLMPVTVTGSGETEVAYSCDTKSYIDRKFDALAAALIGG